MTSSAVVLLGRARELQALDALLERAAAGEASVALVVGEPGIGKTRLLEEIDERASARGFSVGWGRSFELGSAPTYWPFIEALRGLRVYEAADPSAERLLRMLPELDPNGAGLDAVRAAPVDGFALCDAVCGVLRAYCARGPLLLVLDDLHAADPSSLQLATFIARSMRGQRFVLLGSHRDVEARLSKEVDAALAQLARSATVLLLGRLSLDDVRELVLQELGHAEPDAARMIHDASEGNPLFARELLRLLAARGQSGGGVPSGVRLVIRERLSLLSPATVALLQAAALVGREFMLPVAAEVAGVTPAALQEAALEACNAELLSQVSPVRMRFSHALVTETLAADLPAHVQLSLHLRAAHALRAAYARDNTAATLDEVAHHFRKAGAGAAQEAACASEQAAASAYARLAFADAAAGYQHALDALQLGATGDPRKRAELLIAQGEAYVRGGERARAQQSCAAAAEIAASLQDGVLFARAALALGAEPMIGAADVPLARLLERALAQLPEGDDALRAGVMARLASARQPDNDPEQPLALAREAIAMARRVGGDEVLRHVLHSAMGAMVDYAPAAERAELNAEASRLAEAAGDRVRGLRARTRLMFDRIELADIPGFEAALLGYEALAAETGQPRYRWVGPMFRSMHALWEGRFDDAERLEEEARALHEQSRGDGPPCVPGRAIANALLRDDGEAMAIALVQFEKLLPIESPLYQVFVADVEARSGKLQTATERLGRFPLEAYLLDDIHSLDALSDLAHRLQHRELAARVYPLLLPRAGRLFLITGIGYCVHGVVDHALLRLSALLGAHEACDAHARAALVLCAKLSAPPIRARVQRDYAQALLHRGGAAQREQALVLLRTALDTAVELRLAEVERTTRALLDEATGKPSITNGEGRKGAAAPTLQRADATVVAELEGEYWTLRGLGALCRIRDSRGMQMLAQLLAHSGRELHVLELSGAFEGVDGGDAGEVLDAQARDAYRARLEALREELEEAERWNDEPRRTRVQTEIESLRSALSAALGLGGRDRRTGSAIERSRVNVRRRISHVLRQLATISPELGRHLSAKIRTGVYCAYEP